MNVLEREERIIERELSEGNITLSEYNRQLKELYNEYRWQAHKAAQRAYDEELERW